MASLAIKAKKAITTDTKVFNDPIHGSIELPPLLIKIIDTPQFQRLRFIKQLGGAYFVYPGASHNRFEHSIGVAYLAGELATALKTRQPELNITDRDILCVQIAGLCHDLGHGPFSHLYDNMFLPEAWEKKKKDIEKSKGKTKSDELKELEELKKWKHEKGSCDMLDHLLEKNNLKLKTEDMKFMERMITESQDKKDQEEKEERLDQVMNKYGMTPEDVTFIKEMIAQDQEDQKKKKERLKQVMNKYGLTDEDVTFIKEMIAGPLKEGKQKEELKRLDRAMRDYGLTLDDVPFIKEMIEIKKSQDQKGSSDGQDEEKPEKLKSLEKLKIKPEHMELIKNTIYKWPYEGRLKDKAFLYEIVSNKNTGIDVDKFDYLARDSYHLGIKSNFDYHRFKKFARVCELPSGRKTICTRDKEVDQMYDLFSTRHRLHKRAYQHRVNKVIEHMIAEAFLEADDHIEIEGSEGRKFTLSTAFKDMEAYIKLTDKVFEDILNSPVYKLKKARKILEDIVSGKIYRFVGETWPKEPIQDYTNLIPVWKEKLALPVEDNLTPEDFEIQVVKMNYGMNNEDPVRHMHFYSNNQPDVARPMSRDQAPRIGTTCFSEQLIRVFCKRIDDQSVEVARQHFDQWLRTEPNLVGPEGNQTDPPEADGNGSTP